MLIRIMQLRHKQAVRQAVRSSRIEELIDLGDLGKFVPVETNNIQFSKLVFFAYIKIKCILMAFDLT